MPTDERVILVPLLPFDHLIVPAHPVAVKVKVLGAQTTFVTGALIVGAAGALGSDIDLMVASLLVQPADMIEKSLYEPADKPVISKVPFNTFIDFGLPEPE